MYTKPYDEEFKRNCVDLLLTSGRPLKALSRELGISDATLRKWRDSFFEATDEDECSPRGEGGATPREMASEIRRLRKELDRVTEQREILKK